MKTILIPTDFSKNSHYASHYAGMLARHLGASIILLHVFNAPIINEFQTPTDLDLLIKNIREQSEDSLRDFTCDFINITNISPDRITQIVEYGFTSEKIVEIAQARNVDFIVMGTKGATNLIDKWLGTHAERVMKTAMCPVWIIPAKAQFRYPKKIVYAADFEEGEESAVKNILKIAKSFGAMTKVIHIQEYFGKMTKSDTADKLRKLRYKFRNDDDILIRNIKRDDVIEGIECYIDMYRPNLLALAIKAKTFLTKIFETSISTHFVHYSDIPMLTFRK